MASLSAFLAWRYLTFRGKDRNISFMVRLCFLGIFIGSASLMLTLIITHGFEMVISEKMRGINAQCVVYAPGQRLDYVALRQSLENHFGPVLAGLSGTSTRQAVIDDEDREGVVVLKGIDPKYDHKVSSLVDKIITSIGLNAVPSREQLLGALLTDDDIIVGHKLASERGWHVGDVVDLLLPEPRSKKSIKLTKRPARITGIFNIGLEEYDNNIAFCSLEALEDWFKDEGVAQLNVNFHREEEVLLSESGVATNGGSWWTTLRRAWLRLLVRVKRIFSTNSYEQELFQRLQQAVPGLHVAPWQALYPAVVESLALEKYVMFFVIALITLVASLNMVSLLFMQIQQKLRDIAIFKTMGMPDRVVRAIFLRMGLCITVVASLSGLALAAGIGLLIDRYPIIKLPDVYYVSYLPARMDPEIFLIVFFVTVFIGFMATWLPTRRVGRIRVVQVLREE